MKNKNTRIICIRLRFVIQCQSSLMKNTSYIYDDHYGVLISRAPYVRFKRRTPFARVPRPRRQHTCRRTLREQTKLTLLTTKKPDRPFDVFADTNSERNTETVSKYDGCRSSYPSAPPSLCIRRGRFPRSRARYNTTLTWTIAPAVRSISNRFARICRSKCQRFPPLSSRGFDAHR